MKVASQFLSIKTLLLGILLSIGLFSSAQVIDTTIFSIDTSQTTVTDTEEEVFSLRSDTLVPNERALPPDAISKLKEDEDFWYADTDLKKTKKQIAEERKRGQKGEKENAPAIKEKKQFKSFTQQPWFQSLLWIVIVVCFAGFVMMYLSGSNVGLFRKKIRPSSQREEENIPEDIFEINYQKEIDKAVTQGNYRLAVRLHFLRLLKKMAEANIIRYKQDKTNFDYLIELQSSSYYNHFFRVTRNYEYSWYGKFPVSQEAYGIIKNDFENLDRQIR